MHLFYSSLGGSKQAEHMVHTKSRTNRQNLRHIRSRTRLVVLLFYPVLLYGLRQSMTFPVPGFQFLFWVAVQAFLRSNLWCTLMLGNRTLLVPIL